MKTDHDMTATIEQPDRLAENEKQMRQAEELLGSLPQKSGVAKGLFEGRFVADWVFPYPQLPAEPAGRGGTGGRRARTLLRRTSRPRADRSRGRHSARSDRRTGGPRRARHDGADEVRRPRILADGLLPPAGSDRRAVQLDGDLRQRPPFDRHAGAAAVRHRASRSRNGCPIW